MTASGVSPPTHPLEDREALARRNLIGIVKLASRGASLRLSNRTTLQRDVRDEYQAREHGDWRSSCWRGTLCVLVAENETSDPLTPSSSVSLATCDNEAAMSPTHSNPNSHDLQFQLTGRSAMTPNCTKESSAMDRRSPPPKRSIVGELCAANAL